MSPKGVSARERGRQLRQVWATEFCLNLQIDVWLSRALVKGATTRGNGEGRTEGRGSTCKSVDRGGARLALAQGGPVNQLGHKCKPLSAKGAESDSQRTPWRAIRLGRSALR